VTSFSYHRIDSGDPRTLVNAVPAEFVTRM
jgi:hypothetical protein